MNIIDDMKHDIIHYLDRLSLSKNLLRFKQAMLHRKRLNRFLVSC